MREIGGKSAAYIAVALLGVATLSLFLRYGSLQSSTESQDPWAPLVMSTVAVPIYAPPITARDRRLVG